MKASNPPNPATDEAPGSYADRLDARVLAVGHPALVGIDPHLHLLPDEFAGARDPHRSPSERARALAAFGCALVRVVADRVAAVKPQSAFFELLGAAGAAAWDEVVGCAHEAGLLVIGDVKRGDIASTAEAYARAFLEGDAGLDPRALCDAITLNPYLGDDAIEPFLKTCARTGKGIYVLVRTSNPGSADVQLHGDPPLCDVVARKVARWGEPFRGACGFSSIGAVVGATHPAELARLRALMPHAGLLLPGYGAQGAGAADAAGAFRDEAHPFRGALVNSSRDIAFAYKKPEHAGKRWRDATSDALDAMIADLRAGLAHAART